MTRPITRVVVKPRPALPAFVGVSGVQWTGDQTQWLSTGNTTLGAGSGVNTLWYGLNIGMINAGDIAQTVQLTVRWFLRVKKQES